MNYRITHTTTYSGTEPVSVCHNEAWLQPRSMPYQFCQQFNLQIDPIPSSLSTRVDAFGNSVHQFSFNQGYETLTVVASSEVEVLPHSPATTDFPNWEEIRQRVLAPVEPTDLDATQFRFDSPRLRSSTLLADYGRASFKPGRNLLEAAMELTGRIFDEFEFDPRATTVTTPVEEVFKQKKGVCQDFAHLQLAILRSLQLPARYVSGYLRTIPPEGQSRLIGADATHAWLSLYCGSDHGWIDLDPTNNCIPNEDHITVAWGRDYGDVCPLRGVYIGGGTHTLTVGVDVEPVEVLSPGVT